MRTSAPSDTEITALADASAAAAVGAIPYKDDVRAATIAALPAVTATATTLTANANGALAAIDGITMLAGEDILVRSQVTTANNGIYRVTVLGTAGTPFILTRRDDANTWAKIYNAVVHVSEGGTLAEHTFNCTADKGGTLGSTSLPWSDITNSLLPASETQAGIVELATDAEAVTGSDTARAVTPANLTARLAAPGAIGGTTPSTGAFTGLTVGSIAADSNSGYHVGRVIATGTAAGARGYLDLSRYEDSDGTTGGYNGMDIRFTVGTGAQTINHSSGIQVRPIINVASIQYFWGLQFGGVQTAGLGAFGPGNTTWNDIVFSNLTGAGGLPFRILIDDQTSGAGGATNQAFCRWGAARSYGAGTWAFGGAGFSSADTAYQVHLIPTAANKGAMKATAYSLTGSSTQAMVNLAGTVATSGVIPGVILCNLTNSGIGAGSKYFTLQVGGSDVFSVDFAGSVVVAAPSILPTYTVATVPSAATYTRGQIYVSDETGGAVPAFSDGTNWRRVTDRAVVS